MAAAACGFWSFYDMWGRRYRQALSPANCNPVEFLGARRQMERILAIQRAGTSNQKDVEAARQSLVIVKAWWHSRQQLYLSPITHFSTELSELLTTQPAPEK